MCWLATRLGGALVAAALTGAVGVAEAERHPGQDAELDCPVAFIPRSWFSVRRNGSGSSASPSAGTVPGLPKAVDRAGGLTYP